MSPSWTAGSLVQQACARQLGRPRGCPEESLVPGPFHGVRGTSASPTETGTAFLMRDGQSKAQSSLGRARSRGEMREGSQAGWEAPRGPQNPRKSVTTSAGPQRQGTVALESSFPIPGLSPSTRTPGSTGRHQPSVALTRTPDFAVKSPTRGLWPGQEPVSTAGVEDEQGGSRPAALEPGRGGGWGAAGSHFCGELPSRPAALRPVARG